MTSPIRVLIAEDHGIVRIGLRHLFASAGNLTVAGEAGNGAEVLARVEAQDIDVVLLDVAMLGPSGEDLISLIREFRPDLPIMALSMDDEPQIALRAVKAGASGYLSKACDPNCLVDALRRVARGGRHIDPQLAARMAFKMTSSDAQEDLDRLTQRELEVLGLFGAGLTVRQIALHLSISSKTVSTHKANLVRKMGFRSTPEIVRYALLNGLAE